MKIELRNVAEIRPYENNPRLNDDAVDAVAASIREFGFRQPIVVDADGVIICGHTRWKAAQKLGLEKVPVHVAKDLTPEQIKAYRIADNQTADAGRVGLRTAADRTGRPAGDATSTSACWASTRTNWPKLLDAEREGRAVRSRRRARRRRTRRPRSPATCGFSATTGCSAATAASPRTWTGCSTARRSTW